MQTKRLFVTLLTVAMLASCGGNSSSVTPASTGSGDGSKDSSEPASSSAAPVSDVFNLYKLTTSIVDVLDGYRPGVISFDSIKAAVEKTGETVDFSASSSEKVNEAAAILVFAEALKQTLPERIGARSFQGFYFSPEKIEIRKVTDDSKNGAVYKALEYLSQTGIFNLPASSSVSGAKAYAEKNMLKIFDRIHAYFGESLVDDFFTTVNHDYLYDENPYQDSPADGRKTWEEEYNEDDLTHIYDSRLIPAEDIATWAVSIREDIPAADAFIDTYTDWDARATGSAAGVTAAVNKYLAANTADEFLDVCEEMVEKTGYCILWDKYSATSYSLGGVPLLHLTSYSYSDSSATATSNRITSVNRFTPIFHEVLGGEEADAKKLAEDYSDFKIALASGRESSKVDDTLLIVTDDEEKVKDNPKLYFTANFGNGASVAKWFEKIGFEPDCVLPNSAKDLAVIAGLVKDETLDLIKGMAVWQMLQHYTICLPDTEAVNAWAWKPGYGTNAETLWDNPSAFYSYGMPYLSGIYSNYWVETEKFAQDSAAVIGVVNTLKNGLLKRIESASWLSQDAKDKAALKVNALRYSIGGLNSDGTKLAFPALDYKSSEQGGSLYGNIGLSERSGLESAMGTCGKAATTLNFSQYCGMMDPLTANAFYAPSYNGINITLGFMTCYPNPGTATEQELLENYGWVVGHEISHGFDSSGIYFDQDGGNHKEGWFLEADADAYTERCKGVAAFYDKYEVLPEQGTPGTTVMTEAIADINGLNIVMEVAKDIADFDYNHFFVSQAQHYASYASQYTYTSQLASDEHPFGRARINCAFRALNEFHETYGTEEGDNMYVAPADRIAIW